MPVAITLATIALLRGRSDSEPFFDTDTMRALLNDGIDDAEVLQASLRITDGLEAQLQRYRAGVNATVDAYVNSTRTQGMSADKLIEGLVPLDVERSEILRNIIDYRQKLADVLDDDQWNNVFN